MSGLIFALGPCLRAGGRGATLPAASRDFRPAPGQAGAASADRQFRGSAAASRHPSGTQLARAPAPAVQSTGPRPPAVLRNPLRISSPLRARVLASERWSSE